MLCYAAAPKALFYDKARADLWFRFAALLRFAFFGLLGPMEPVQLKAGLIMAPRPGAHALLQCAVAKIAEPKNRSAGGRVQVRFVRQTSAEEGSRLRSLRGPMGLRPSVVPWTESCV